MRTSPSAKDIDFVPAPLRKIAPYFLLVLAIFAAYGNIYDNDFVYDDASLILKNVFLQHWSSIGAIFTSSITAGANIAGGFYRPLQILLYLIVYQLAGPSTVGFHLLNVALHALNACAIYKLGCRLRFRPTGCFFAALLWALHPVHIEVITYMSGTADPLYTFFCLLGVIILLPEFQPQRFLYVAPVYILGLLSKEEALIFPLLVMSCMFYLEPQRFHPKTYLRTLPLWLVTAVYVVCHKSFLSFGGFQIYRQDDLYANSVLCRIYTCLASLPSYFGFLVWPVHLHFDRNFPNVEDPFHLAVLIGFAMVAAAMTQIALGRSRKALVLSWGLLWFAGADVLHTGILVPLNAILLEHWLYLPSIGLFLALGQLVASTKNPQWQRYKPAAIILTSLLALLLGFLTWKQNTVWKDEESLYLNIFKNGEPSPHAHNNLGVLYALRGEYEKALEQYELSIELSGDTNAQTQHDLGITLLNGPEGTRYTQEAIKHFMRALEIDPDYYPADLALAALYEESGDKDKANLYREKAAASQNKMIASPP